MTVSDRRKDEVYWTNSSILPLLEEGNPIDIVVGRARSLVFDALQKGWSGPPFDPFFLAEILKLKIAANGNVLDARTLEYDKGRLLIEFNPNRPRVRIRFSIAHEIAHTLFMDCKEFVRERQTRKGMKSDDWQLEMLCNIAASEILMPIGSFKTLSDQALNMDNLLELKDNYDVSIEALLHRVIKVTDKKCFSIFCSKKDILNPQERYRVDYILKSNDAVQTLQLGAELPLHSHVEECTAIGFTSKGYEHWPALGDVYIECIGIPPYQLYRNPRVAGIVFNPNEPQNDVNKILYIKGDATNPRGRDKKIIALIINDKGLSWGAGFARCLQKKWPFIQRDFKDWALKNKTRFSLGNIHSSEIDDDLSVFKMICQHGYGESLTPRIRYHALEECLKKLSKEAIQRGSSVHMPRIGAGEAGGSWEIISELIESNLCKAGIRVTVYDLPNAKKMKVTNDLSLFDELK